MWRVIAAAWGAEVLREWHGGCGDGTGACQTSQGGRCRSLDEAGLKRPGVPLGANSDHQPGMRRCAHMFGHLAAARPSTATVLPAHQPLQVNPLNATCGVQCTTVVHLDDLCSPQHQRRCSVHYRSSYHCSETQAGLHMQCGGQVSFIKAIFWSMHGVGAVHIPLCILHKMRAMAQDSRGQLLSRDPLVLNSATKAKKKQTNSKNLTADSSTGLTRVPSRHHMLPGVTPQQHQQQARQ
jgi:hypothetical protein